MQYTFSYTHPHRHIIDIEFTIDKIWSSSIDVQLPAWRPGRYELGNFAKNIQHFKVLADNGNELKFKKQTKDTWKINTEGAKTIHIHYGYYANELNAGSTFLDEDQLYVNPVNCCLYVRERIDEECHIVLDIPKAYKVATGLTPNGTHQFRTTNFHELADSPFIASSTIQHDSFKCQDVIFNLWFQGECAPDWQKIKNDLKAYTEVQIDLFGDFPVSEYHYLYQLLPYPAYHGVEHQNSTVISLGPGYDLMKKEIYDEFLGVSCHELFHTWNVKNIRPIEMKPYDYSKENYSPLGYVAEGITTYYGDLLLYRSNVFTEEEFLKLLSVQIQRHMDNFGRYNYSVAESSFDTWLDGYVAGIPNRKLSIYSDGCLLAFMADILIMKHTNNAKRLDDVMLKLYHDFGKMDKGYSEQDYKNVLEEISSSDFTSFFNRYVNGHNSYELLLKECIEYAGIELHEAPSPKLSESRYGMMVDKNNKVVKIFPNAPADNSGIAVGDVLLTVNNHTLSGNIDRWMEQLNNEPITLMAKKKLGNKKITLFGASEEIYFKRYSLKAKGNVLIK